MRTCVRSLPGRATAAEGGGLFEAAGCAARIRRSRAEWEDAEPAGPVRADPLLALGFDLSGRPSLLYAESAAFEAELPPRRLAALLDGRSSGEYRP